MSEKDVAHEFFEMMKTEHEELAREMGRVRHALDAEPRDRARAVDSILRMHELVESHFEHEEQDGYMNEPIQQAPHLTERADHLLRQHPSLLEEVTKLRMLAKAGVESESWWEEIHTRFDRFSQAFLDHEAGENKLIQEVFTQDVGTGD